MAAGILGAFCLEPIKIHNQETGNLGLFCPLKWFSVSMAMEENIAWKS